MSDIDLFKSVSLFFKFLKAVHILKRKTARSRMTMTKFSQDFTKTSGFYFFFKVIYLNLLGFFVFR